MQNHEIVSWIRKALKAEEYIDFRVELNGKNSATEGYTSDMIFAKVFLAGTDKKRKELNLAFKFGKKALRQIPAFKEIYRKEIYFYENLMEIFGDLQKERNIKETFDGVANCYTTFIDDNMEIIVLENLSEKGFALHRRDLTMNIQHFKLVLKNFAKLHSLSIALQDKDKELFKTVAKHFSNKISMFTEISKFLEQKTKFVIQNLREAHREDLADKFQNLVDPGVVNKLRKILDDDVDVAAIVHFDCHCNNFMFQYKEGDKENPTGVAILDWQMAKIHSPATDLSYFLYSVGSKKELSEQKYLFKYYYEEFSNFLLKLGCDAESLFPYSTLLDHWKKYSLYGFIYACCFLDFDYINEDGAAKFDDVKDVNSIGDVLLNVSLNNPEYIEYMERLITLVEHYFDESFL